MNLKNLPKRIARILLDKGFKICGRDIISKARIHKRNDLKRIGTKYGGWVIPAGMLHEKSICYCAGCGEDISFDLGLIQAFGCDVYAFDPTPRSIKYVKENAGDVSEYHFYEWGLWDKEDTLKFYVPKNPEHVSHSLVNLQKTEDFISVKVKRLADIMKELGHQQVDLLKIDIEGAEYKVLQSILEDDLDIPVICVEYDECFNPLDNNYRERVQSSVNSLIAKDYRLVYSQGRGNYTFVKSS
jgi:FkbM family methyltransferase